MKKEEKENLNKNLKRLEEINEWFDEQENVDVEKGLVLVTEAAGLIKSSKKRLSEIENQFEELKKDLEDDQEEEGEDEDDEEENDDQEETDGGVSAKEIPF